MLASPIQPTGHQLSHFININNLAITSAQSEARISTRKYKRRNSRQPSGIFIVSDSYCPEFMTGWEGCFRAGGFLLCR